MALKLIVACCAILATISVKAGQADTLSMAKKADLFQRDMEARFLLDGQALCKLRVPTEERPFLSYNMPDNAYMTGIYLGTLSMKYAVTNDPADKAAARQSMQALHLLCNVSGTKGLWARAAWPADRPMVDDGAWRESRDGKYKWRSDVSSDQVNGVLFGYPLAYDLVANDAEKAIIAADVSALVDYVVENGLRIIDYDGKPTKWGNYSPKYVKYREPMNALLWLQVLKVAEHVTGEARYADLYHKWALDEGYAEIAVRARRTWNPAVPGAVNYDDDMSIFLAYDPLLRYENDPDIRRYLIESLRRVWEGNDKYPGAKPQQNPFFTCIAAKYLGDESQLAAAVSTLRWFPLDMKWNKATIAKYEAELNFSWDPHPRSPEPKAGHVVPIDRRARMWSAWVEDPYRSAGDRTADQPMEYNGHDYLLAYWMWQYYH